MRQRELSEREQQIRPIPDRLEMTIRTTDKKADFRTAVQHPAFNFGRQRKAFHILAAFVQNNDFCPRRNICLQKLCLLFLRRIVLSLKTTSQPERLTYSSIIIASGEFFLHLPMAKTVAFISFLSSKTLTVKYICPTLSTGIDI